MRVFTLVALGAAALLPALASEAQVPEPDPYRYSPFEWCERLDSLNVRHPPGNGDDRAWTVWDLCLDQVTYMSRWSEFTEEEIYDYLIAAEAAKWGKEVSKDCDADSSDLAFARKQLVGMLANALATRTDDDLDLAWEPTYLAWAPWRETHWRESIGGITARNFWQYYGQWDDGDKPYTSTVAINKHLLPPERWKYIVHEAMHWGPDGWPTTKLIEELIRHITDSCVERDGKKEKELKKKDKEPPPRVGWTGGSRPNGGGPRGGGGFSCTIYVSRKCGGGGFVDNGTCDDDPSNNEDEGPDGEPICRTDEIVAGGCTYRITGVRCRRTAMVLEDTGMWLADLAVEGRACPATPAAGPPPPERRPSWIATAAIAPSDDRRRPLSGGS